jgi:FtsP/CotA-like multicopper oxidase with cupredoxin domain
VTLRHEPTSRQRSAEESAPLTAEAPTASEPVTAVASDLPTADARTGTRDVSRRTILRVGASGAGLAAFYAARSVLGPSLSQRGLLSPDGVFDGAAIELSDALYTEVFPTSPLILKPFEDELPIPKAARPVKKSEYSSWPHPPGPGAGQQNFLDDGNSTGNDRHQCWSDDPEIKATNAGLGYPDPVVYKFDVQVATHSFTKQQVLPINAKGQPTASFDASGRTYPAGTVRTLPDSTIYGFNGTFPGPRINAEYGRPVLIRFENHLDENPQNLDRQDFGSPDYSFLTHLHNGHTAPESDGNPHYSMTAGPKHVGYRPKQSVDNLYLNWPAGGLDSEKQSFFWFHDHRMDQTGSNVYKGMVGIYPIYDPKGQMDDGDETTGLHLPGVRKDNGDGSFDVDYDIPLVLFDCRLDDGVTTHHDIHDSEFPEVKANATHPEWWGKTFFKHFPNHGFVGDIFTVNGTAYPTLRVKRRKYRLRFLDASIARIYELKLMSSTQGPKAAKDLGYSGDELQGQYRLTDGQQCMKWTQIASDGGLLPVPIPRDSFELWPAKRREFIVDFTKYMDGSPTTKDDVIYLTNVMKMPTGRMWSNSSRFSPDTKYQVPILKIIIEDLPSEPDASEIPTAMRTAPPLPSDWRNLLDNRLVFEVQRGSGGGETEWMINGKPFDPSTPETSLKNPAGKAPLAQQKKNSFNLWEIRNGGGGWVHPFHLHMEEHRTVMRNGRDVTKPDAGHPDDASREDLVALDPSESVIIYRGFRDFTGPYVAHCHNLAHEDHAMMFGWEITP